MIFHRRKTNCESRIHFFSLHLYLWKQKKPTNKLIDPKKKDTRKSTWICIQIEQKKKNLSCFVFLFSYTQISFLGFWTQEKFFINIVDNHRDDFSVRYHLVVYRVVFLVEHVYLLKLLQLLDWEFQLHSYWVLIHLRLRKANVLILPIKQTILC